MIFLRRDTMLFLLVQVRLCPKSLDIPGAGLRGVIQATYLLHMANIYNEGTVGRDKVPVIEGEHLAVMGCGNVAMDAARTAVRMGAASVTIVYRRTEADMPAIQAEYQAALQEGVKFLWQTSTTEFLGNEDGKVSDYVPIRRRESRSMLSIALPGCGFTSGQSDCVDYGRHRNR